MKKLLLLAGLAVAATVSCTKNETFENGQDGSMISFSSPVVQPNTKAVAGEQPKNGKYSTDENFAVYATWTKDSYSGGDWGKVLYMNNVKVSYDETLNGWAPADAYYWPKNGKLTFAGYSPADVKGTVAYGKTGLTVTGFKVEDSPEKQYDFMYAERSYNRTASTNQSTADNGHTAQSYKGVDLVFHHALSSIVFKVKSASLVNTKFTVKKVEILNAQNAGNFSENISDGTPYVSNPAWSDTTGKVNYTAWSGTQVLGTTDYAKLSNASDIILLPQPFKHGVNGDVHVTIKVTYSIQRTETNAPEIGDQVAEFDLSTNYSGTVNGSTSKISKWEMGKRYIYNILFDLDKIYFSPEATNWVDVNTNGMTIK